MDEMIVFRICFTYFGEYPSSVKRCSEGIGNYVFRVECCGSRYIVRCSIEKNAYRETVYWLNELRKVQIPVPEVLEWGRTQQYEYLILSYVEGHDIGLIYTNLTVDEKRMIAKELVQLQNRAALLKPKDISSDWSWLSFVRDMLDRAEERIVKNGYFDKEKVEKLRIQAQKLDRYFAGIKPTTYLDDISSKNLLIHNGKISGIIDVDWIGIGDKLTYVALTNVALLNLEFDTDYVTYILEEMQATDDQIKAFLFYSLMYCVDFMGERGMYFMDKKVEVNQQVVDRLNRIYDMLWEHWCITQE